jgi:hypothetical protein
MPSTEDAEQAFPGDGEMARRMRAHDWAATPSPPEVGGDWYDVIRLPAGRGRPAALCRRAGRAAPPPAQQAYLPRRMDPVEADGLSGPGLTCRALARALARWLAASASSASWAWRVS